MKEREKYKAEIEARLCKFDDTLHEIKAKQKERRENPPKIHLAPIIEIREKAGEKFGEIVEERDEGAWDKFKRELDDLVNDIDDELRKALAYFN